MPANAASIHRLLSNPSQLLPDFAPVVRATDRSNSNACNYFRRTPKFATQRQFPFQCLIVHNSYQWIKAAYSHKIIAPDNRNTQMNAVSGQQDSDNIALNVRNIVRYVIPVVIQTAQSPVDPHIIAAVGDLQKRFDGARHEVVIIMEKVDIRTTRQSRTKITAKGAPCLIGSNNLHTRGLLPLSRRQWLPTIVDHNNFVFFWIDILCESALNSARQRRSSNSGNNRRAFDDGQPSSERYEPCPPIR